MASQRVRVWGVGGAVVLAGGVAWFALGGPPPETVEPIPETSPVAATAPEPTILRNSATESAPSEPPSPVEPSEPIDNAPRPAPGPAPWADGEDLPPPEIPDEAPVMDPEHMRYREAAANVPPATQVAYLERSMVLLDTSITQLEARRAQDPESPRGRRLNVRLERLRQARTERGAELEAMRARAAQEPEAAEAPADESP